MLGMRRRFNDAVTDHAIFVHAAVDDSESRRRKSGIDSQNAPYFRMEIILIFGKRNCAFRAGKRFKIQIFIYSHVCKLKRPQKNCGLKILD